MSSTKELLGVLAMTAALGGGFPGQERGYRPLRRKVPKSIQEAKEHAAELKRQRKASKRAPASTKYAVYSPADQTVVYMEPALDHWSIDHKEAVLFDTWPEALSAVETSDSSNEDCYIEFVTDEAEFRARENTW